MLSTLTTYLLQYKQVAIPSIGSFKLTHRPATLDFASRLIMPPTEEIVYERSDAVSDQQRIYLSEVMNVSAADVNQQLESLGRQLKESLAHQAFEWRGIGKLEQAETGVVFHSLYQHKLTPVEAHKVMRENVSHAVTVGDKEMQSHEAAEWLQEEAPRSYLMIIVWVLIALALLFIGYLFYTKGFSPLSSGSQERFGYVQQDIIAEGFN